MNEMISRWLSVTQCISLAGQSGNAKFFPKGAAARGTAVHKLTEMADRGQPLLIDTPETVDLDGYLAAYANFKRDRKPKIPRTWIERRVSHQEYRYVGHMDRIMVFPEHPAHWYIVDIKTQAKKGSAAHWWKLQSAGYRRAMMSVDTHPDPLDKLRSSSHPNQLHRASLIIRPDGSYTLTRYFDHAEDEAAFLNCLALARWTINQKTKGAKIWEQEPKGI